MVFVNIDSLYLFFLFKTTNESADKEMIDMTMIAMTEPDVEI